MKKKNIASSANIGLLTMVIALVGAVAVGVIYGVGYEQKRSVTSSAKGSGAPSGAHYNLNIIGVPKGKTADMTGGHRIFVPLVGKCSIALSQGEFAVLDGNCTDGKGSFQLPSPDPDNDGVTTYSVWARALGKPGGKSETTTCAFDALGVEYCSASTMIQIRNKGKSTFSDVSRQLLYVYTDLDGDGILERVPLFDERLRDYFWSYDNNGLKIVQLRFYEIPTNVN